MSEFIKVLRKYKPDCDCFNDEVGYAQRMALSAQIARAVSVIFMEACAETEMCRAAMPHVLDDLIMNIATNIAVGGTIIECGSVESEREMIRVLTGIEARLIDKVRLIHEGAREEIAAGSLPRIDGRGEEVKS